MPIISRYVGLSRSVSDKSGNAWYYVKFPVGASPIPRLLDATPKQRREWELIGGGIGIHWDAIDEDILVASLLKPEHFMRLPGEAIQRPQKRLRR
jgi:uncharacterized protein DUF2442